MATMLETRNGTSSVSIDEVKASAWRAWAVEENTWGP